MRAAPAIGKFSLRAANNSKGGEQRPRRVDLHSRTVNTVGTHDGMSIGHSGYQPEQCDHHERKKFHVLLPRARLAPATVAWEETGLFDRGSKSADAAWRANRFVVEGSD
jgi:hypothetical protein